MAGQSRGRQALRGAVWILCALVALAGIGLALGQHNARWIILTTFMLLPAALINLWYIRGGQGEHEEAYAHAWETVHGSAKTES